MMKVSQNTNEINGPHKRLYTVISVVEHGSWVQNLDCFKSYVIVNNQLFSQFDYILGLMSHQKVRSYGNGTLVCLGKFNIYLAYIYLVYRVRSSIMIKPATPGLQG